MLPEGVRAGGRVLQALEPMEGNWSEEAAAALGALFSFHCVMRACCMRCMVTSYLSGSVPVLMRSLKALRDLSVCVRVCKLFASVGFFTGILSDPQVSSGLCRQKAG